MQKRTLVYISIPLPEVAKAKLQSFINKQISASKYPISWVEASGAQIMLITMGNLAPERVENTIKAVERVVTIQPQFAVNAHGLGYFAKERAGADPTFNKKNRWVVYLDVPDKSKMLRETYKKLFKSLAEEGFFPPTHFNPRVSLGYLTEKKASREERENILENLITEEEITIDNFPIDRININELKSSNPTLIKSLPLKD